VRVLQKFCFFSSAALTIDDHCFASPIELECDLPRPRWRRVLSTAISAVRRRREIDLLAVGTPTSTSYVYASKMPDIP
jgi:hypothetical protein